ncbi:MULTISPECIES: single-stranded DNA-binding protein [Actinomycetes]|uniref:Single-stranded DNA-binding protein n=1 Tax=Brevibacterium luteolum TaxID=199591 RepID=A0A2N6PGI1_9MICO|nr:MULTISPECIES: single-stranded DNA-binding protein [Actinomycetes]MBM7231408.1 single-stranded DNA-binding protein [Dietzia cinnamea]MCT2264086.1 single-stranded DNA-binding protein [Dietzia cinnamea]PMB97763.1 single-stranded DNA-binding protein [Brevibacterium luteolum]PWD97383.1 single-stranded DNA-binding protein [Dietzia maris]
MAIQTQESLSGFIASDPQLRETSKGDARFYARIGKEHFRREDDGSFTQIETSYHHMVMFGRSADHAHAKFAKGDNFIAEGYTRPVSYERNGQNVEGEEFVAKKIGHDTARTRYDVDRTPRRAALEREATAFEAPHRPAPAAQSSPLSL